MKYWIVSSKHSRDESTKDWISKWTTDAFLRSGRFYPSKGKQDFAIGDRCLLKVFGNQTFVGDYSIASEPQKDKEGDINFDIIEITEWDFPLDQHLLPKIYTDILSRNKRNTAIEISERMYHELLGIRNFTQNLRINYKNKLRLRITELDVESMLDAKNALNSLGMQIVDRQIEITPGNRIDLLCTDQRGDFIVVELKKHSANETVGQLARYVTDVSEHRAKSGQKVRGLILAMDVDEQLIKAARGVDFDVVLYQLTMD